jgi:hypothetical protein
LDAFESSACEAGNPANITKEIKVTEIMARAFLLLFFFIRLSPFSPAKRLFHGVLLNIPGPI